MWVLAPWPGIEPAPWGGRQSFNHWATRGVHPLCIYDLSLSALAFLSPLLPSIFCFCATIATLSLPKLTFLIIIFLPFWTKIGMSISQYLKEISFWMWFLPEIKHSPHAYPSMQHFPVSPSSSPDLKSVGLSWVSPSPERFANSPSKGAHIDLHFHICCPDSVLIIRRSTLTLLVPPNSSPL